MTRSPVEQKSSELAGLGRCGVQGKGAAPVARGACGFRSSQSRSRVSTPDSRGKVHAGSKSLSFSFENDERGTKSHYEGGLRFAGMTWLGYQSILEPMWNDAPSVMDVASVAPDLVVAH
jgi:hypothetical protein